jgi:hypothetical protein
MVKLHMIMQYITLCTPCIAFILVSHTYIFAVCHVEQGTEVTLEPAQVEGVNPKQDQGKPQCI